MSSEQITLFDVLFNSDGYPCEASLKQIEDWRGELIPLLDVIQRAWCWEQMAECPRPGIYTFATGGWSGNESLLGALKRSIAWRIYGWDHIEVSGGLLCVATTIEAAIEMRDLHRRITEWAWRGRHNDQ